MQLSRQRPIAKIFNCAEHTHKYLTEKIIKMLCIDNNIALNFPATKHRYELFQNVTLISLLSMKNGFNKVQKNISKEQTANIENFTG